MSGINCHCAPKCGDSGTYRFKPVSYGHPCPTYVNIHVRQNGVFQDYPLGYVIPFKQVEASPGVIQAPKVCNT